MESLYDFGVSSQEVATHGECGAENTLLLEHQHFELAIFKA